MRSRMLKGLATLSFVILSAPTFYDLYKWLELLDKEARMKQPSLITPDGDTYYPDTAKDRRFHADLPSCYATDLVLNGYSKLGEFKSFNPNRTFDVGPDFLHAALQCLSEKIESIGPLKGNATDLFTKKLTKAFIEETQLFTQEQMNTVARYLQSAIVLGREGKPTGDTAFDLAPRSGHVSVSNTGLFGKGKTQIIFYKNHRYTDKQIDHAVNNFMDTILRNTQLPRSKKTRSNKELRPIIRATS